MKKVKRYLLQRKGKKFFLLKNISYPEYQEIIKEQKLKNKKKKLITSILKEFKLGKKIEVEQESYERDRFLDIKHDIKYKKT